MVVPARVRERGSDFAGKVRFTRNEFSPTNNGHPAPLLKTSGQIAMKILVLLAFCASATIAFSADPFHGSWKKSNGLSGGGKYGEIAKALLFSKLKFKGMSQLFRE